MHTLGQIAGARSAERAEEALPGWFKLILHHQRKGNLALTLPFLLGAARQPVGKPFDDEASARRVHDDLLRDVGLALPDSHFARVFECPRLRQPVLSITPIEHHGVFAWGYADHATPRFYIESTYAAALNIMDSAANRLWELIGEPVLAARFSFADGAYRAFGAHDKSFIATALAFEDF